MFQIILALAISLVASCAGAICGIGGGVIIKPVLDAANVASVSVVSFLSGCTVLCMSSYSVLSTYIGKGTKQGSESAIRLGTTVPLSLGAVVGGIMGKTVFSTLMDRLGQVDRVGAIQAVCLLVLTLGTLLYTIYKKKIKQQQFTNVVFCVVIGFVLGFLSSFLGIGGGPFNLVILSFCFSMDTKVAAQNSLFVILCSQISSLISSIVSGSVPDFSWGLLIGMAAMGILGGVIGKKVYRKLDSDKIDVLFMGMLVVIMGICIYNFLRFGGVA